MTFLDSKMASGCTTEGFYGLWKLFQIYGGIQDLLYQDNLFTLKVKIKPQFTHLAIYYSLITETSAVFSGFRCFYCPGMIMLLGIVVSLSVPHVVGLKLGPG